MAKSFIHFRGFTIHKGERRKIQRQTNKWKEDQTRGKKNSTYNHPSTMKNIKGNEDSEKQESKNRKFCCYRDVI